MQKRARVVVYVVVIAIILTSMMYHFLGFSQGILRFPPKVGIDGQSVTDQRMDRRTSQYSDLYTKNKIKTCGGVDVKEFSERTDI